MHLLLDIYVPPKTNSSPLKKKTPWSSEMFPIGNPPFLPFHWDSANTHSRTDTHGPAGVGRKPSPQLVGLLVCWFYWKMLDNFWDEWFVLLMAEILHHLRCMKPL